MVVAISDFIKIPDSFKYVIATALILGTTVITIPILGITIGEIYFSPVSFALNSIGIFINFQLFVILFIVVAIVLFSFSLKGRD